MMAIQKDLETLLNDKGIDHLSITGRIKDFESFFKKVNYKGYTKPFAETEDICGLRIVCFFTSDLVKVSEVINREFTVLSSENKQAEIEPDRFGYRSDHYIVTLKKSWLEDPNHRRLGKLKAEIQVRTILMHGWADVEHKFGYKKIEDMPPRLRRNSCRLSALLEIADELLDDMRREREEYMASLDVSKLQTESILKHELEKHGQMDMDLMQFIFNHYIPDIASDPTLNSIVLSKFNTEGLNANDLIDAFDDIQRLIPNFKNLLLATQEQIPISQGIYALIVLAITNEKFWKAIREELQDEFAASIEKLKEGTLAKNVKAEAGTDDKT